ncbi:MAG: trypsin-like peptidase domain-containing protein, partial [bacterium]
NNHVIEDAQYVTISVTGEEQISGRLVGTDATSDLAVFSVSKQEMIDAGIETISVAKFANSDEVEVGDFVYPIGNALGEGKTMTQGMISANNKQINIDGNDLTVLQTDAAINPGNSGGALIDSAGLVVGINTAKLASSQIEGIGYAIPSNIATEISDQIIENGYVQRPYFGVAAKTITQSVKEIYGIQYDGVLVSEVEKGSNAEKAGLVPTDIIISFNGSDIKTAEDLSNAIKSAKLNETFDFEVIRNNSEKLDLTVTFAIPTQQDNMKEFSTETTTKETTQSTTKEMTTESTTKDQQEETSEEISNVIPETMTEAHKSKKEENNITENNTTENNTIENITESTTESDSSALNLEDSSNNYFSDEVIPDNNINSTTEIIMTPDEIVDSILESLIGSVVDPQNINPNIDFNE